MIIVEIRIEILKKCIINYLSEYKDVFYKKFGITKLGLFGSYARNEAKKDSDIDILIEFEDNLTDIYDKKYEFKETLAKHFNLEINIAREKYLKPFAREEILKEIEFI